VTAQTSSLPGDATETMKFLRENRKLRQANEMPGKATAWFAMAALRSAFKR